MGQRAVTAALIRGGTSKGAFFRREDMPSDESSWDRLLLESFGSPDPSQVDGVGGGISTASKVMIVSESDEPAVDLDYEFAQVAVTQPVVDWGGNCGNMTFGVGPFGLEAGLVTRSGPEASLVLRNVNTGAVVEQTVPLDDDGKPEYVGDFVVHGTPRPGARIRSTFREPGGSETGELFPTGNRIETLDIEGVGPTEVSILDVSNPVVFVHASDFGVDGRELPAEINADDVLLEQLEQVRSHVCAVLGIVDDPSDATSKSPGLPKIAFVGDRQSYTTVGGDTVEKADLDVLARTMSLQKAHHAYAVTGGMCTAAAALLEGTLPNQYARSPVDGPVALGHPKGIMEIGVEIDDDSTVVHTWVDRTARLLMDGSLYYRPPTAGSE